VQFATIPNCRAYDPAFAYETAIIVDRGMQEMLEEQTDRFYYMTLMNATYAQPSIPPGDDVREGILKGIYRLLGGEDAQVQLFGSGAIMTEVLAARELLKQDWGVAAAVWSVTSYVELQRDGIDCERCARLSAGVKTPQPFITRVLERAAGPVVAASDYVRALPELVRAFVRQRYVTLGTDGFGRSDTRGALRAFFEVDAVSVVIAALKALADEGAIEGEYLAQAVRKYDRGEKSAPPWTR
jgi:pyruvate dehydrogenase E1 component